MSCLLTSPVVVDDSVKADCRSTCSGTGDALGKRAATEQKKRRTRNRSPVELASLGDIFVNDAFRYSTQGSLLYSRTGKISCLAVSGFLIEKEVKFLGDASGKSGRDRFIAIMGGAKVGDKIPVMENLIEESRFPDNRRRNELYILQGHGI